MYITDTSWIFLNMPEPNKYKKIHQISEINEYKFINYMEEKRSNNIDNKFNKQTNDITFINNNDSIHLINFDNISKIKQDIDRTNIYNQNYRLNINNNYYTGNMIDRYL